MLKADRTRMVAAVTHVSRGTRTAAEIDDRQLDDIAAAVGWLPQGVACLLTAAHLHGLALRPPQEVWLATTVGTRVPPVERPRLRVLHWAFPGALKEGVGKEVVGTCRVRITDPARTVVDLIRYGSLVGGEEIGMTAGQAFALANGSCSQLMTVAITTGAPRAVMRVIRFLETTLEQVSPASRV
jgi:predicted transcriptional regulator of viral defense system